MISQSDFYYEIIVDIVATSLFALLLIIIFILNYFTKSPSNSFDLTQHNEQNKNQNKLTNISRTTQLSDF